MSAKLLRCVTLTCVIIVVLLTFCLQMTIIRQHRQLHFEKLAKFGVSVESRQSRQLGTKKKTPVVHYQGEEDMDTSNTKVEQQQQQQQHVDDHEHADEDPHLHQGGEGDMVMDYQLPQGFKHVLQRAKQMEQHCDNLNLPQVDQTQILIKANLTTDLPSFGIIHKLESYRPKTKDEANNWNCQLPPETECQETQITVVFMGYRPDRLAKLKVQVNRMTEHNQDVWKGLIKEVILVWNGDRELDETKQGRTIMRWANNQTMNFRIFYPLKEGFPNDLMNRYHPRFGITTKCILMYDDDGPFYSVKAITSGFQLWKRNANAEIGAMARRLDVTTPRAKEEKNALPQGEREWVSNCRAGGDLATYNFHHFAQTGANMALPSGSFLHRNFMCFLWHPVLEEIREFVRAHPVHPDDVTVSTIVSHVSGRAPKTYSRRVNRADTPANATVTDSADPDFAEPQDVRRRLSDEPIITEMRRRLLWDDGNHGVWAQKRETSVNSLLGYFGSINSGSDGWCFGTPYHDKVKNICVPDQARVGMLSWMSENHESLQCPDYRTITEALYMAKA